MILEGFPSSNSISTWIMDKEQIEDWTGYELSDNDFETIVTAIDNNDEFYSFIIESVSTIVDMLVDDGEIGVTIKD